MPILSNIHNNVVLVINILKNEMFDVNIERADFENWIPFVFELCIEGREMYTYSKEHGATFSLEDIKRMISGFEAIIIAKSQKKEMDRFIWGPTEFYFSMQLYETFEENEINVELWIVVGELTQGKSHGYNRGFQFVISLDALKSFTMGLKEQLSQILECANFEFTTNLIQTDRLI